MLTSTQHLNQAVMPLTQNIYLKMEIIGDIAMIRINNPGEKVNTLNQIFLEEIESCMKFVSESKIIKGAVIISSKPDSFIAGADIKILQSANTIERGELISSLGQRAFQTIEDCKKPVL